MTLQQILRAIHSLEIQGAEEVATAGLLALDAVLEKSKAKTTQGLIRDVERAQQQLVRTRSTEPEMRNYLNNILRFMRHYKGANLKHATQNKIAETLAEKRRQKKKIIAYGVKLLKKNSAVYTHCHSSTVNDILKAARKKKIYVHNTETRPLFQGRKTAKELAKAGIPVTHFVDSAMVSAVKNADIILIGADAVTHDGVYNKIGSELVGLLATHFHIPLYVCTSLLKFDAKKETIEQRPPAEVWDHPPKKIKVHNPAFEIIHFTHVKGMVCEEGILTPKKFLSYAKRLK